MPVSDIQRLGRAHGAEVIPNPAGYDDHSPGWTEAEYHGRLTRSTSVVGYWEGEPGWVRIDSWPSNEVCVMLEGLVAVTDSDGARIEFAAGDAFLIPVGFSGTWHTLAPTRKFFVGVVADAAPGPDA